MSLPLQRMFEKDGDGLSVCSSVAQTAHLARLGSTQALYHKRTARAAAGQYGPDGAAVSAEVTRNEQCGKATGSKGR